MIKTFRWAHKARLIKIEGIIQKRAMKHQNIQGQAISLKTCKIIDNISSFKQIMTFETYAERTNETLHFAGGHKIHHNCRSNNYQHLVA